MNNDKPLVEIDNPTVELSTVGNSHLKEETVVEDKDNKSAEDLFNNDKKSNLLSGEELAAIKEQLKAQLLEELKDEQTKKLEEARLRREKEQEEHQKYIETMKQSPDPWVDIVGWVHTDQGVKVELEWNDAFVDYLRSNGISGTDEEQVVQKWVTLLLRDMADQMEDRYGSDFE